MTKTCKITVREEYLKALEGGRKMLKRAAELDKIALTLREESNDNPDDLKISQAAIIGGMADEMRQFYNSMFN